MQENKLFKLVVSGVVILIVMFYFFSAGIKTITEVSDFQQNLMDYKGVLLFLKTTTKENLMAISALTVFITGFLLYHMGLKGKRYEDAHKLGVHGTSRWGKPEELKKGKAVSSKSTYYPKNPIKTLKNLERGLIVGQIPKKNEVMVIPLKTSIDNRNILLIGSSGSGKGQSFVYPNVINNTEETMIITDPKGEIYEATHQIKRDQGYEVYQIDFIDFKGDGYNPLDYVRDDQDAQAISKTISKNSAKDGKEDFFFNTAKDLLTGLIIYAKSINPNANIPEDVKRLFYRISEDEDYLKELCEEIGEGHPAYDLLKDASVLEGKTRSSVLSSFAQQTAVFSLQKVANMTKKSTFNFREFQKKKSVLYIKIRMDENPFSQITAVFFDQLISELYNIADENKSKLPIPTIFILDEFANIGRIEKYGRVLATCRGLGISMCTVVQDLAQLEEVYGKEMARSIINNHDTLLYLRTKDTETAKYLSNLAGETTVRLKTDSYSKSGGFLDTTNTSKSTQEQYLKRELITDGELINIDKDTCILFVSGYYPLKLRKAYQYELFGDFLFKEVEEDKYEWNYPTYRAKYIELLNKKNKKSENPDTIIYEDNTGGLAQEEVKSKDSTIENVQDQVAVTKTISENVKQREKEDVKQNEQAFELLAQEYFMSKHEQMETKNNEPKDSIKQSIESLAQEFITSKEPELKELVDEKIEQKLEDNKNNEVENENIEYLNEILAEREEQDSQSQFEEISSIISRKPELKESIDKTVSTMQEVEEAKHIQGQLDEAEFFVGLTPDSSELDISLQESIQDDMELLK